MISRYSSTRFLAHIFVFSGAASVAACVTPSARIASALTGYGLDAGQAQCAGDRLEDRLSLGQLQQLGRAARSAGQGDTSPGRLTVSDLIRVSSQIRDPQIAIEVTRAAVRCGVVAQAIQRF